MKTAGLSRRGVRAFNQAAAAGSSRVELFLRRRGDPAPAVIWPRRTYARTAAVRSWFAPWMDPEGELRAKPTEIEALAGAYVAAYPEVREHLRVSRHFGAWLERRRRERSRRDVRVAFLAEVDRGTESFDLLRYPLLPYQRDGMMHLAFGERALLADEMGLGKLFRPSPPASYWPSARASQTISQRRQAGGAQTPSEQSRWPQCWRPVAFRKRRRHYLRKRFVAPSLLLDC